MRRFWPEGVSAAIRRGPKPSIDAASEGIRSAAAEPKGRCSASYPSPYTPVVPRDDDQPAAPIPSPSGSGDDTALHAPAGGPDPSEVAALREGAGSRIGPYKLIQLIGEGGFGSVFLAEQDRPVVRRVALKIIKLGMDTRQVVARFEQERQALALMNHPNIAKVFDAGSTETGRPFFVMELCGGDPIVAYCDREGLGIEARLELFVQVCHAIQHAHTKGVIHRDIKPSNILVATQDGRPIPKVIDFGIAKATAAKLTARTLVTEHRALIGTPEYMSPEQAEGSLDIDTRTDVYALGVLLYELLTGTTPFSGRDLRSAAHAEIQRIIREVEPPKPSTRLSANADSIASVAARRQTDPRRLGTIIRGELDWIVMKALDKDRGRRYGTASDLAADVRRHLAGEAVLAAPPGTLYLFRKFLRRHRLQVSMAAIVALSLLAGLAGTAWQAKVASDLAVAARAAEAEATRARDAERARADELALVSDFQAGMLAQVDPNLAGARLMEDLRRRFADALTRAAVPESERSELESEFGRQLAMVNATDAATSLIDETILRPAVRAIDARFAEKPLIDAQLRQALAELYHMLGRVDLAMPLQESALSTRQRLLGADDPLTLLSTHNTAVLLRAQGKFAEAETFARQAVDRRRVQLGPEHEHTLVSMHVLGSILFDQGRMDEADRLTREVAETSRRTLGEDHPSTVFYVNGHGALLASRGRYAEAEPFLRSGLEQSRRVHGADHDYTLKAIQNLAIVLRSNKKMTEAEALSREALDGYRRVRGEEHPETLSALKSLGALLRALDRPDEAEPLLREAFEKSRRILGDEHPDTLSAARSVAVLLASRGAFTEAEAMFRDVLEKSRRALGDDHPQTIGSISNLAAILTSQRKHAESEPYCREALERNRRLLGAEHATTLESLKRVFVSVRDQERPADAEPIGRELVATCERALGAEHPNTLIATCELANLLRSAGRYRETLDLLAPIEAAARRVHSGRNAPRLAEVLTTLGRARVGLGFDPAGFAEAEAKLLEAHGILIAAPDRGPTHRETLACVSGLVELYTAWNAAEPAARHEAELARWRSMLEAPASPAP